MPRIDTRDDGEPSADEERPTLRRLMKRWKQEIERTRRELTWTIWISFLFMPLFVLVITLLALCWVG